MVKPSGPTNPHIRKLIVFLEKSSKKNKARIWKYVSELLGKPRRNKIEVNLYKIDKFTKNNEIVLVPGKVLSIGEITKKNIKIAALKFSKAAKQKLKNLGIEYMDIRTLVEKNPKGSNVRIII